MRRIRRLSRRTVAAVGALCLAVGVAAFTGSAPAAAQGPKHVAPNAVGGLDCNGFSPIQRSVKMTGACTDPKGYDGGRFYDNGHYIGHDEPIVRFMSSQPGSGNDITWSEQLPRDPAQAPTVGTPGSDVTHWFELSIAPWFSMALCNPESFPYTPCKPQSDSNAPVGNFPWATPQLAGGGSSFLEMQFYPPGFGPFPDSISCDNTHWCASLHINDLECNFTFETCNPNCIEPTNFAFIQTNGVPTGPPSPQLSDLSSFTPNAQTLLMNPGDKVQAHIFDANLGGGQHALETQLTDLTTGQSGFMIASAANGFMATSHVDCSGTPFNYEPEFSTARPQNAVSWAALQLNVATQFEIGHFTPCKNVSQPRQADLGGGVTDTIWNSCTGPYETTTGPDNGPNPESSDSPCFPAGDTHGGLSPPNLVTGCANFASGGDVDFDGTPYWPDWPNQTTPNSFPSTFLQQQPTSNGKPYPQIQFQTDAPASESTCQPSGAGCAVPAPGAPGNFYPYWTLANVGGACRWEFGQMPNGNSFGGTGQYGSSSAWFFGTLEGPVMTNPGCT
jgi:hypothetical protein